MIDMLCEYSHTLRVSGWVRRWGPAALRKQNPRLQDVKELEQPFDDWPVGVEKPTRPGRLGLLLDRILRIERWPTRRRRETPPPPWPPASRRRGGAQHHRDDALIVALAGPPGAGEMAPAMCRSRARRPPITWFGLWLRIQQPGIEEEVLSGGDESVDAPVVDE